MLKTASTLFLLACCLISFSPLQATDNKQAPESKTIHWHGWSEEPFKLAQEQNKPVLIDLKASWCQFCEKMASVTYQDPGVIDIVNQNFIPIRADIEKDRLAGRRYGRYGVPATVILDGQGKEINRRKGYIEPQFMQWHLLGTLQDIQPLASSKD